jgi:hypothetical protein
MASRSSGLECNVQEFGGGFALFETLGNHPESQGLHAGDGFIAVGAVAHHTRQGGHLGDPAAVILAVDLDRKNHAAYCTIRPGRPTSEWSWRRAKVQAWPRDPHHRVTVVISGDALSSVVTLTNATASRSAQAQ